MSEPAGPSNAPRALPPGQPTGGLAPVPPAGPMATAEPSRSYPFAYEEEAHFWDYWRILVRHRWTVITSFLVAALVATVWAFTSRPVFTGTATLKIEREEPRVLKFDEVVRTDSQEDYNQTQFQTQYRMLQSRSLANRVIGVLQLDQHPEFHAAEQEVGWQEAATAWVRERLVQWIPVPPPPVPEAAEDLALASPLTSAFLGRLSAEPVRNARLVKVSFDSHYPDLAARVANTLAEAFIGQQLDLKIEATRYATQFLAKQMEEARGKLESAETGLNQFLARNDILLLTPLTPERAGERQDLVSQQLAVLSDALLRARTERIARESLVVQTARQDVEAVPAVLQSALVARLKEELVTLQGKHRELSQTFKPEYPRMQRMGESIAEVQRQLRQEMVRVLEAMEADYRAALRNEQELQKGFDEQRQLARRLGDQMPEYTLLRRDLDTSRELYTALLTRLKETQIAASLLTSNISIVDRAEVPLSPSRPRKELILVIGSLVGLLGGLGLAFFFEYLDTNIKDVKDAEAVLRIPSLGLVPSRAALESRRSRRRQLAEGDGEPGPFALVAHDSMNSVLAEAFRNLRTSLLYSTPDHPPKTLIVTSLQPDDGKTSLATNLGITLAQLGAGEVLLIDGDMRHPNLHELFELPQTPGLSTFLTGQAELPAVLRPTPIPNLYVIPAGRTPLNPAELLASTRLSQALSVFGERFTHIVIDTTPLFGVSDAMTLAPRVEGVVLVLRHGRASRDAALRATQMLTSVHARLLGVVLNDVDVRGSSGGAYGYYGYHGYYGYYGYGAQRDGSGDGRSG